MTDKELWDKWYDLPPAAFADAATPEVCFRDEGDRLWHITMEGLAGHFDPGEGMLWLSRECEDYEWFTERLAVMFSDRDELWIATDCLDTVYKAHAKAVVRKARAFRNGPGVWQQPGHWLLAITPPSFTIYMRVLNDRIWNGVTRAIKRELAN
jgi:hypothetical protein